VSATPPPPPDEPTPPPEAVTPDPVEPGDAEAGSCPRCGSPYARGQEYCLECGLRLPLVRGFVAGRFIPNLGRAWRRHFRWYPGDWIWPIVFGLIIAAAGATVAILTTRNDDNGGRTIIATGPTETVTGTETAPTETAPTETAPTETAPTETTPTETTPTEPTPTGPIKWPPGQSGFTIILASIVQSDGLPAARKTAQKGIDAGLKEVGILNSSNYSSLNPGYYVVFSGVYGTIAEAQSDLAAAKSSFPQAYTRKIVP
jgi:cell division septation protein DedD